MMEFLPKLLPDLRSIAVRFEFFEQWPRIEWKLVSRSARHNRFEMMADSDVVKHLRKYHQESKDRWEANVKSVMPGCCDIKEITWDTDHIWNDQSEIYSIETEDGQNLYPTPAPAASTYLLIALFPILGFLIPWGAIRAIGWVLAGFIRPSK